MINGDYVKNVLLFLLGCVLFGVVLLAGMHASDVDARRDCDRGITWACKYAPPVETAAR